MITHIIIMLVLLINSITLVTLKRNSIILVILKKNSIMFNLSLTSLFKLRLQILLTHIYDKAQLMLTPRKPSGSSWLLKRRIMTFSYWGPIYWVQMRPAVNFPNPRLSRRAPSLESPLLLFRYLRGRAVPDF